MLPLGGYQTANPLRDRFVVAFPLKPSEDPSIKGGAWYPLTVKKSVRCLEGGDAAGAETPAASLVSRSVGRGRP